MQINEKNNKKNISFNKTTGDRSSGDRDIQQIIFCFFYFKIISPCEKYCFCLCDHKANSLPSPIIMHKHLRDPPPPFVIA